MQDEPELKYPDYVTLAEGTIASDYALKNLNKALGESQNEFTPAVKAEENKYAGYKYVPLECIIDAVRSSLTKHHLTVSQFTVTDLETKTIAVFTRVVHWDSGEWIQNMMELPAELALGKEGAPKFNQQTIGGSQTYAQKYAYKAILGVPDSEEMIDSTDEKGDLPARSKAPRGQYQEPTSARIAPAEPQGPFNQIGDRLTCVIRSVIEKETKEKHAKYLSVTFNGYIGGFNFATCFDSALFPTINAGKGKECTLLIKYEPGDKFINILEVLSVDGVNYAAGIPVEKENDNAVANG